MTFNKKLLPALLLIASACLQAMEQQHPPFPTLPVPPAIAAAARSSSWLQPTFDITPAVAAAVTDVNKTIKILSVQLTFLGAKVSADLKTVTKIITDQVEPITDTINKLNTNLDDKAKLALESVNKLNKTFKKQTTLAIASVDKLNDTLKLAVKNGVKLTINPLTVSPATVKNLFRGASGLTLVGMGSTLIYKELTKSQGISTNLPEKSQKTLISTCKQLLHNRYIIGLAGITSGVYLINSIN